MNNPEYLQLGDYQVPYVVFDNEDDVTTAQDPELGERLEVTMDILWTRYKAIHK
jgi:cyanate lyase